MDRLLRDWVTVLGEKSCCQDIFGAEVQNSILVDRLMRDRITVAGKKDCYQYSLGGQRFRTEAKTTHS